jgi:hypothetical protein
MSEQPLNRDADERFLTKDSAVFAFGAARSGKSTLGALAASLSSIDHIDEPFDLIHLTASWCVGNISEVAYVKNCSQMLAEMKCESILMRRCNFRPHDVSSVWRTKGLFEIRKRVFDLKSRLDASSYLSDHDYKMWVTCTDLAIAKNEIAVAHPYAKSVAVIRDPLEVACATQEKGWFSDQSLTNPTFNTPVHSVSRAKGDNSFLLPWWLKEKQFDDFVKADEIGRGLIYWEVINEELIGPNTCFDSDSLFKFNEIVDDKESTLSRLLYLLNRKPTLKTRKILKNIYRQDRKTPEVSSRSLLKYGELLDAFQLNK